MAFGCFEIDADRCSAAANDESELLACLDEVAGDGVVFGDEECCVSSGFYELQFVDGFAGCAPAGSYGGDAERVQAVFL